MATLEDLEVIEAEAFKRYDNELKEIKEKFFLQQEVKKLKAHIEELEEQVKMKDLKIDAFQNNIGMIKQVLTNVGTEGDTHPPAPAVMVRNQSNGGEMNGNHSVDSTFHQASSDPFSPLSKRRRADGEGEEKQVDETETPQANPGKLRK